MICKESFCKIMNGLRDYNDELEKVAEYLHITCDESFAIDIICDAMEALAKDVGDTDDDWLGYFAWELDFGRAEMAENCIEVDGKKLSLKSAEELYDYLKKNMKCKAYDECRESVKQDVNIQEVIDKQIAKAVIAEGDDESDFVHCPRCNEILGINEYAYESFEDENNPPYCYKCGQKLKWWQ